MTLELDMPDEELPLPEDTEANRTRRLTRPKKPGPPKGAARSPDFNKWPGRTAWVRDGDERGKVVRQPVVPEWMKKPAKPPTQRRTRGAE